MKNFVIISRLLFLLLFSFIMFSCEKNNPAEDLIQDPNSELNISQLKAVDVASSEEINYLRDLIFTIETMHDDGLLNKGNANALIVKIENAIKSIESGYTSTAGVKKTATIEKSSSSNEKGNDNSAQGKLKAFINQVNALVNSGELPPEEAELLIKPVEKVIMAIDGSFVDPRDEQEYKVVLIGDQLWMAENLKVTKFNDGTDIPLIENIDDWTNLSTPGYCWYNNDFETYGTVYGGLYNWHAVNTGKLSPEGWHVPSDEEWHSLVLFLDPGPPSSYLGVESEIAGGKLKEIGTEHWLSPNEGATDEFGFTALGGDARYLYREYYFIGEFAHWWSSTEDDDDHAWVRWIGNWGAFIYRQAPDKRYGLSVRCVKD